MRIAAMARCMSGFTRTSPHRFPRLNVHSHGGRASAPTAAVDLSIVPAARSREAVHRVRAVWALLVALGLSMIVAFPAAASARRHVRHTRHRAHTRHRPHARHQAHTRHRARFTSGTACPGADARVGHAPRALLQSAVVCLVNQERYAHHLPPLHASAQLNRSAQGWTNAMVSSDQFTHGANFSARISAAGFVWRAAGENIATGFATPRAVVRAWMGSTGHCENILNPTYRNVGTGVSSRPVRGYASGAGTWTQDFG